MIKKFVDEHITSWLKDNENVECEGDDRRVLEDKLDEMLFIAGYYTVRIGHIKSLSEEELENFPGVDITQIQKSEKVTSEELRLELNHQATKKRRHALRVKVRDLIRERRGVIQVQTSNGKTSNIGDRTSRHPESQKKYKQDRRDK